MDDRFGLLQEVVLGQARLTQHISDFPERCHRRLLAGLHGPTRASAADLAGLVRHVLRREEARQGGVHQEWWVPKASGWPTAEQWRSVGVEVCSDLHDRFRIQAVEWAPLWLAGSKLVPPCRDAEAETLRRNYLSVPGDPCLSEMGYDTYRCGAQREMVRGVLTAPPGATLLCNLPTGAGKSLVAQLAALLRSRREGVSVVVVPTTALAMDQERSIATLVPHPTAYYPGTLPDGSDRRGEIRRRILDGTQRIVFTSPESAVGALSGALYAAAEGGWLRLFVVDEVHIVSAWGGDFRSSFQELAGVRRDLLRTCAGEAFVTLLMTATLSQECLGMLESLFADPGPLAVSSAVQVRPEPSYWMAHCESVESKQIRLLEAVHNVPRPLIVYTTKRAEADLLDRRLRGAGYRRCAKVTGSTPTEKRQRVVERWKTADVDIVVATSAFGLGVDQEDVRAVVHACVPESVDRFYQEVGRGGRDGSASLSLILYTDADLRVADRLSRMTLIGNIKGPERWRRMFFNKEAKQVDQGLYRVPVGISPGVTATRIDMVNARNLAWNVNTLTLMSRAGVLQMDAERPPAMEAIDCDLDDKTLHREQLQSYREHRVIRILDPTHLDEATWHNRVEPVRRQAYHNSRLEMTRMRETLQGERCIGEILAESYQIHSSHSGSIHVLPSCGGCPACRAAERAPYVGPLPDPLPPWPISREMGEPLAQFFARSDAVSIFYDEVEPHAFERFLRWLVALGIRSVVLPPELPPYLFSTAVAVLGGPSERPIFFSESFHFRRAPRVPTLIVHPPGEEVPSRYLPGRDVTGIPRVLFLPKNALDPRSPHRHLRDVLPHKLAFSEFLHSQGL